MPGVLLESAAIILVTWALMVLAWKVLPGDNPGTQAIIHRMVLVTLVAACLMRAGVVGYDLTRFPLFPSSHGPVLGVAGTPSPAATATPSPSPSPTVAASPTTRPRPTATPTPVPAPRLTISPTPPGPVTACAGGNNATFTVAYVGSANPATITVTSASTSHYLVSLDGNTFGPTAQGQIASGTSATVWVQAVYNGGQRNIYVDVTGFSRQTMYANTNGC